MSEVILPAVSAACAVGVVVCLWKWNVLRPGAFPVQKERQREVWGVGAPVWLLCAGLVLLAQMLGGQLAWMAIGTPAPAKTAGVVVEALTQPSLRELAQVGVAANALGIVVGVLVLWQLVGVLRADGARTGIRVRGKDAGEGLVAVVLAAPVCLAIGYAGWWVSQRLTGQAVDPVQHETLKRILDQRESVWAWVVAANAVIGAPIVEEIVYRGLLQSCVLSAVGRTWPAVLVTATVFALVHLVGGTVGWEAIPTLAVLGVALGIAYERTRSLGVPIVMHALFNLGNVAAAVIVAG